MLKAAGNINQPYEVIGVVVSFASQEQGCNGELSTEAAYRNAVKRLEQSATEAGGDALIHINFQNRMAVATRCTATKQVFEVCAWGTAVKLASEPK